MNLECFEDPIMEHRFAIHTDIMIMQDSAVVRFPSVTECTNLGIVTRDAPDERDTDNAIFSYESLQSIY